MPRKPTNPNSDLDYLNKIDINQGSTYPRFVKAVEFTPFRSIDQLTIQFQHPVSVISGTNKIGKSTILLALACSHFEFHRRNTFTGKLERQTWSDVMKFTESDVQDVDWTYYLTIKTGDKTERKRGQRKHATKKWNGLGKKESQVKNVRSILIDIDRILPARYFPKQEFNRSKHAKQATISSQKAELINEYISYILEIGNDIHKISGKTGKDIYAYKNDYKYSSFNSATGEDTLSKIVIDMVEAPDNSLVLIDEIELGLHPQIQRRLMHVVNNVSRNDKKQFVITTHSPTIINSVEPESRIFIEKSNGVEFRAIKKISVNAALSKMDSHGFPLIDVYCEDDVSRKIINKAVSSIQSDGKLWKFSSLVNVIESGSAEKTYENHSVAKRTYQFKKITSGYACILDGDMREQKDSKGVYSYPAEDELFFIFKNAAPEKFLCEMYEKTNSNSTFRYHIKNSNAHCLFSKMVELGISVDKDESFEKCWSVFICDPEGQTFFEELKRFLIERCKYFSPDL